jgi:hypothetical protein
MTIGTTIISERDRERLATISSIDDLDNFNCLYLDVMITIDFEMLLNDSGKKWVDGNPIVYDPDGLAIFKIDRSGLDDVVQRVNNVSGNQKSDLHKLADFVRENASSDFYEVATF